LNDHKGDVKEFRKVSCNHSSLLSNYCHLAWIFGCYLSQLA